MPHCEERGAFLPRRSLDVREARAIPLREPMHRVPAADAIEPAALHRRCDDRPRQFRRHPARLVWRLHLAHALSFADAPLMPVSGHPAICPFEPDPRAFRTRGGDADIPADMGSLTHGPKPKDRRRLRRVPARGCWFAIRRARRLPFRPLGRLARTAWTNGIGLSPPRTPACVLNC